MKRVLIAAVFTLMLLMLCIGSASADWWIELDFFTKEVTYHEDGGETFLCNSFSLHFINFYYHEWDVTNYLSSPWLPMTLGGNGESVPFEMISVIPTDLADGTLLGTLENVSGYPLLLWDWANPNFSFNVDGVSRSGSWMFHNGHLNAISSNPPYPCMKVSNVDQTSAEVTREDTSNGQIERTAQHACHE